MALAERMLRAAALRDVASALESFLNEDLPALLGPLPKKDGEVFHSRSTRTICSAVGRLRLQRDYYVGPDGGRYPLDEQLGLHRQYTPAVVDLMCWTAAMDNSFALAEETFRRLAGLAIPGRQIQRVINERAAVASDWQQKRPPDVLKQAADILTVQTDMTGIPMRKEDLVDIKGKQPDGSAKTRQIKVGCVFTQSKDGTGAYPFTPGSATYLSAFTDPVDFGKSLYAEALKRGYAMARKTVFLGDGADWIWNIATDRFKGAVQIVDFYHACEHLHSLIEVFEPDERKLRERFARWRTRLKNNGLAGIIRDAEAFSPSLSSAKRKNLSEQLAYFYKHAQRMRYRTFLKQGFLIGSGAVEGACRHIVAQRAKLSGMRWHPSGAHNVLVFRCLIKSSLFDDFCVSSKRAA